MSYQIFLLMTKWIVKCSSYFLFPAQRQTFSSHIKNKSWQQEFLFLKMDVNVLIIFCTFPSLLTTLLTVKNFFNNNYRPQEEEEEECYVKVVHSHIRGKTGLNKGIKIRLYRVDAMKPKHDASYAHSLKLLYFTKRHYSTLKREDWFMESSLFLLRKV